MEYSLSDVNKSDIIRHLYLQEAKYIVIGALTF
jgi:hypothetical protein